MSKDTAIELFNKLDAGDAFPPIPGKAVYAVFIMNCFNKGAEHLMYIGSSKDIEKRRRWKNHPFMLLFNRLEKQQKYVYVKYFYSENYLQEEALLINYFKPIFNRKGK